MERSVMEVLVFFVGLSLLTNGSGHPIAILPKFDTVTTLPNGGGILSTHDRLIIFPRRALRSHSSNWPLHDNLWAGYDYVRLRDEEVTFTGSGGTPRIPGSLPHLKDDCCGTMRNIKPEYLPAAPGAKSIVNIDHGKLRGTKAK